MTPDMGQAIRRAVTALAYTAIAAAAAVLYGIVNDQVTVTIAPEYYSVLKRHEFAVILDRAGLLSAPPRFQVVVLGVIGSWWLGLWCGAALGLAATIGPAPPVGLRLFVRALSLVVLAAVAFSVISGTVAYAAQPLVDPLRWRRIALWGIEDVRSVYAAGWWHTGAYAGGLLGALVASGWVIARRSRPTSPGPASLVA